MKLGFKNRCAMHEFIYYNLHSEVCNLGASEATLIERYEMKAGWLSRIIRPAAKQSTVF